MRATSLTRSPFPIDLHHVAIAAIHRRRNLPGDTIGRRLHGIIGEMSVALCGGLILVAKEGANYKQAVATRCCDSTMTMSQIVNPHICQFSNTPDSLPDFLKTDKMAIASTRWKDVRSVEFI